MRWKRYLAYRDSGVEWLGEVPEHWDEYSLRWCVEEINTNVEADDMLYIGLEHIESWTGKVYSVDQVSEVISGKHFLPGDVLFGRLRPYLAKGFVADEEGICSGELLVLRPNGMNRFYLHFVLLSPGFVGCVDSSTYGARMPRASWEFIRKIVIPVPSIGEQERIASFIEVQTCGIDTLISKKQRQLELLEEKRTALITHAVTKGLDSNVKMKDSGVEWLGEVPEHWGITSAKWVYEIQLGKMLQNQPNSPSDKAVPYLKAAHVKWGSVSNEKHPTMWATLSDVNSYGVRQGDLLVCEGGEPGRAGMVGAVPDGCIMQNSLHRVRAENQYDLVFLLYVLWKANKCGYLETECNKATITHFTGEKFGNLRIPWPTENERELIADFLDNETSRIDALRDKIQQSIETLQEYRSALISAAVTGQIDVREEVV